MASYNRDVSDDPRNDMLREYRSYIEGIRAEQRVKMQADLDAAHAKLRFLQKLTYAAVVALSGAVGTALVKVFVSR
jgi:hypothetical protein